MKLLTFTAVYGDQTKTIRISHASGSGDGIYIIEEVLSPSTSRYIGDVVLYNVGWTPVSQLRDFTMDDKAAILERMLEAGLIDPGDKVNW